jgi:hypothetical protein
MRAISINRPLLWAVGAGVVALATVVVATSRGQTPGTNQQPIANGGQKQWVAFDPLVSVASTPQTKNMIRIVMLVNTSTAPNTYSVTYEHTSGPNRLNICTGTLQPGQRRDCGGVGRASSGFIDGYFQVRGTQPLIAGGYIDLPVQDWEPLGGANGQRLKSLDRGTIQRLPFDWQPGCPPRAGSGCPTGQPVISPG